MFFCNSEQIRLAQRFVSSFVYETDANFSTNDLKMPLSILVGILITRKPFPFSSCFITSESTAIFNLIEDMIDERFFYKYPRPEYVCGDFAKGLASATPLREATRRAEGKEGAYILQLCEWHGVGAIKRHLVAVGIYPKDLRDEIINLIWKWVKSSILAQLKENRSALLNKLLAPEQDYLLAHYKAKEHQFFRA